MYKIAVCDDAEFTCSIVEKTLLDYRSQRRLDIEIQVFYTGEGLLKALQRESMCFDILFLDIQLEFMNGVHVAEQIREVMENEEMLIIYISCRQEYAMRLFKTRPMDFLVKPFGPKEILAEFSQAKKLLDRGKKLFECRVKNSFYKVPYDKILYFQSIGRKIILYQNNKQIEFYDKLDNIESYIQDVYFWRIHKSYLVNYRYIAEYGYETVKMKNGDILPISQSKRKQVRKKLLDVRKDKAYGYRIYD